MTAATVLRIGQDNGAGGVTANFLQVFGGEVLAAFEIENVTMDKTMVRTISNGKSASFPATWRVTAGYHTPGAEIVGQASNISERIITIDDLLFSSVFLANIDEAMSHFEVRSIYSREVGRALSVQWDKNVLQVGTLAARAAATVTGASGGTQLTSATTLYKTSASDLAAGLFSANQTLDEKNIPSTSERYAFMKPAQYYLLAQSTTLVDRDFSKENGDYAAGKILRVGGCRLVKTNNLPTTVIGATSGENNTYAGDFTKTAALVMTQECVGTVKLLDLGMEMDYDIRRQGTLIVAKYAVGHGILRPECAVELDTTT